ncbi:MAG: HAD-IIIA family hydrolase [Verrucomicrobiota bacterium]
MSDPEKNAINWPGIKALLLDSDGVLTDGGVYLPSEGSNEYRRFDIKDGFGITRLLSIGFPIAVISRSPSTPVWERCRRLGVEHVFLAVEDKVACAEEFLASQGIEPSEAAFMGDDVPDLKLLKRVGYPMAPNDASPEVLGVAKWISQKRGGFGAVREVCDLLYFVHSEQKT